MTMENLPAIKGGKPVRPEFLVFGQPVIEEDEIQAVVDTLKSGWISTGPRSIQFAKEFKEYVGSKHAIATNSCTASLHLCLKAIGVGHGDEVITTPMTFAATVNVIEHCGAKPVFADIQNKWFNIDPYEIEKKITKRTKAIIAVHFAGLTCDLDPIHEIAHKHGIPVIQDAAHAIGSEYQGKKIGGLGDFTCFSFYVTKNMTTAEGGMVTTNNPEMAKKIEILSLHGLDLDAWQRYSKKDFKHYEIAYPGYKYNMTDIAAALGSIQLKKLERFIKVRKEYADFYQEELGSMDQMIIPEFHDLGRHAWHLYPILLNTDSLTISRDDFISALHYENIGVGVHYRAVHFQKYYRETYGYKRGDFPNAEFVSDRVVSMPLSAKMTKEDAVQAVTAVKKILKHYKR